MRGLVVVLMFFCGLGAQQLPLIYNRIGYSSIQAENVMVVDSLGDGYGPQAHYNISLPQMFSRSRSDEVVNWHGPIYRHVSESLVSGGLNAPRAAVEHRTSIAMDATGQPSCVGDTHSMVIVP